MWFPSISNAEPYTFLGVVLLIGSLLGWTFWELTFRLIGMQ